MSFECNNIKLAIRNDKSEVICATCKNCLIITNHDVFVFNFVNGMKSRGKNHNANVSNIENQKKHKANVKNNEKLGSEESLASPRPSKLELSLGYQNLFMVLRLGLFQAYDKESKAAHQLCLEVYGNGLLWKGSCFNNSGDLCYTKNDHEDIGKLCAKAMAFEQCSSKPKLEGRTSRHITSELKLTYALSTITPHKPTKRNLELLFESMYDDYMGGEPSDATRTSPAAPATLNHHIPNASTTTIHTALKPTNLSIVALAIPNTSQDVDELQQQHFQQQPE
ncbi:hypothetical protein Tco_0817488 [Tanacetum coccineum]